MAKVEFDKEDVLMIKEFNVGDKTVYDHELYLVAWVNKVKMGENFNYAIANMDGVIKNKIYAKDLTLPWSETKVVMANDTKFNAGEIVKAYIPTSNNDKLLIYAMYCKTEMEPKYGYFLLLNTVDSITGVKKYDQLHLIESELKKVNLDINSKDYTIYEHSYISNDIDWEFKLIDKDESVII